MSAIDKIDLPLLERFGALDLRPWYWFALALVAVVLFVNFRLRDSRLGRAWIALRDDEGAAASVGVPIVRTKLLAYGAGAALGGVSGAFLASYLSTVNSHQFTFSFSIFILAMVVLGGLGSIWGVVVGAIILSGINNYLLPRVLYDVPGSVGLDFDLSEVSAGIYGFLLVIIMLLRPEGVLPAPTPQDGLPACRAPGRVVTALPSGRGGRRVRRGLRPSGSGHREFRSARRREARAP